MLSGHRFPESLLKVAIDTITLAHIIQPEFYLIGINETYVTVVCIEARAFSLR